MSRCDAKQVYPILYALTEVPVAKGANGSIEYTHRGHAEGDHAGGMLTADGLQLLPAVTASIKIKQLRSQLPRDNP